MDAKSFYRILIFGIPGFVALSFSGNPVTSNTSATRDILNKEQVKNSNRIAQAEPSTEKGKAYTESVRRMEQAVQDTLADGEVGPPFHAYGTGLIENSLSDAAFVDSNPAYREWKRFQRFEEQLFESKLTKGEQYEQFKGFARDSLQILTVKLIATKRLEERRLLELDIAKNPDYYLALLDELKASDIPSDQYFFLEKKLAYLTKAKVEHQYAWSKAIIVALALGFLVFAIIVFRTTREKLGSETPDLSGQEKTIKSLILEGKTNKEIAAELFISVSTVKTHITHIYRKLNVGSRSELLRKTQN